MKETEHSSQQVKKLPFYTEFDKIKVNKPARILFTLAPDSVVKIIKKELIIKKKIALIHWRYWGENDNYVYYVNQLTYDKGSETWDITKTSSYDSYDIYMNQSILDRWMDTKISNIIFIIFFFVFITAFRRFVVDDHTLKIANIMSILVILINSILLINLYYKLHKTNWKWKKMRN